MDQDRTWRGGGPWSRLDVLDGDPAPLPKKGADPQFSAHICCNQMAGLIKMPLGMEERLSYPGDFVLDGDPAPLPKKGTEPPPKFSAHVHCGQTAGWIKIALGTKVGLGPGYIVLHWDPASLPKKGGRAPLPIVAKRLDGIQWMHQDATWYGGRPQPRRVRVRWEPSPLPKRGAKPPPQF